MDLSTVLSLTGIATGVSAIAIGTMKGVFVTKKDCKDKSAGCLASVRSELSALNTKLDHTNNTLNNTGKWIVALASKQDIKESDLPNL